MRGSDGKGRTSAEGDFASTTLDKTNSTICPPLVSNASQHDSANSLRAERCETRFLLLTLRSGTRACVSAWGHLQDEGELTSTRSPQTASGSLLCAKILAAYFACFGVPSIAILCAFSRVFLLDQLKLYLSLNSLRVTRGNPLIHLTDRRQSLQSRLC
jgi:hypothetical protein